MWPLLIAFMVSLAPSIDPASHVRAESPIMRALLDQAALTSPTVRALIAELDRSDTIVYVEFTAAPGIRRARTKLVAAPGQVRFLRVTMNVLVPPFERIPLLAHELQHAAEIAREPDVRDDDAVRTLYRRIGRAGWQDTFETEAAADVERRARAEQFSRRSGRSERDR